VNTNTIILNIYNVSEIQNVKNAFNKLQYVDFELNCIIISV